MDWRVQDSRFFDLFAVDFAVRHLISLSGRAASALAVTLVVLFCFFK